MRWRYYQWGDTRTRSHFCWLPFSHDGITYWLESVTISPATWRDWRSVIAFEKLCFDADAWTALDVAAALTLPSTVRLKAEFENQMIGLVVGMLLYLGGGLFAHVLGRVRGEPIAEAALGFGDVTLLTFIGLVVGVPEVLLALVIGILSGGIFAGLYLLVRGLLQRRYVLYTAIPYGPFLILGGATMLYFGQYVMAWYTRG